ncbi:MAG: inverse autotransporter beta domain-containing protein [Burkholderiaceae bacterium]|nr:inverse autotransporter beta domain-containing protein [Burkholderiaceae bacterium]
MSRLKSNKLRIAVSVFSACVGTGAYAQNAGQEKWSTYLDLEGKVGSKRDIGEANLFIPVVQDARSLYFANVRARLANGGDFEGSLGGGMRHMLETGWNLGAYGFVDRRRTTYNNSYDQATLGFEALGSQFDWRANVYQPFGKKSTTLSSVNTGSVSGGSLFVTSTVQEERALPGFDVEAGWRLPIFDEEDTRQVRAYLAGYRFSDDGIKVQGTRVRAEYVMADFSNTWKGAQLTIGAEYQDDNARGSQSFVALRLRIPLGSAASSAQRMKAQERRMTAPVVRDVDIVSQVSTRQIASEKASTTAGGQTIVALSSETTTGASLPGEVAAAGSNSTVVLAGTFNTTASTVLQNGQTLIGKGSLDVVTASGRTVTTSLPGATINSSFASFGAGTRATVAMANNSTISGMNIVSTDVAGSGVNYRGINTIGVSNVRILDNTVSLALNNSVGSSSTALGVENSTNVIIGNNSVSAYNQNSNAAALVVLDSSVQIFNNRLSAQGSSPAHSFAVLLADTTGSALTVLPNSTGNAILNGACDIPIATPIGAVHMVDGTTCP